MLENNPFPRLRLIAAESEALAQEFSLHSLPVKMLSGVRGDGYMPSGCSNILVACPPEDVDFCTPYLALGAETSGTRILHGGYAGFPLPRKPEHEVALPSSGLDSFVRTHLSLDAASARVMFALSDPECLQRNHARWTRCFGAWKLWGDDHASTRSHRVHDGR